MCYENLPIAMEDSVTNYPHKVGFTKEIHFMWVKRGDSCSPIH
jgi:hypothetical protein